MWELNFVRAAFSLRKLSKEIVLWEEIVKGKGKHHFLFHAPMLSSFSHYYEISLWQYDTCVGRELCETIFPSLPPLMDAF